MARWDSLLLDPITGDVSCNQQLTSSSLLEEYVTAGADLHRKLKARGLSELHWLAELSMATEVLNQCIQEADVVLTQGAGETAKLSFDLASQYRCEVAA